MSIPDFETWAEGKRLNTLAATLALTGIGGELGHSLHPHHHDDHQSVSASDDMIYKNHGHTHEEPVEVPKPKQPGRKKTSIKSDKIKKMIYDKKKRRGPHFIEWLESNLDQQMNAPASAEVIRTGIQPQVGMEDISQRDEVDHDEIMGLDSHVRRLSELVRRMKSKGDKSKKLQDLTNSFVKQWEKISMGDLGGSDEDDGLGDTEASEDQLNFMKDNQPLPEPPRSGDAIPGGKPPIS